MEYYSQVGDVSYHQNLIQCAIENTSGMNDLPTDFPEDNHSVLYFPTCRQTLLDADFEIIKRQQLTLGCLRFSNPVSTSSPIGQQPLGIGNRRTEAP